MPGGRAGGDRSIKQSPSILATRRNRELNPTSTTRLLLRPPPPLTGRGRLSAASWRGRRAGQAGESGEPRQGGGDPPRCRGGVGRDRLSAASWRRFSLGRGQGAGWGLGGWARWGGSRGVAACLLHSGEAGDRFGRSPPARAPGRLGLPESLCGSPPRRWTSLRSRMNPRSGPAWPSGLAATPALRPHWGARAVFFCGCKHTTKLCSCR